MTFTPYSIQLPFCIQGNRYDVKRIQLVLFHTYQGKKMWRLPLLILIVRNEEITKGRKGGKNETSLLGKAMGVYKVQIQIGQMYFSTRI